MTDQEKRQQRVNLQIEIEDADANRACLREKAHAIADRLEEIAKKVRENAHMQPSKIDFTADGEMATRLAPECQSALNFDEISKTIEELRTTRQKVFKLSERKTQLLSGSQPPL